MREAALAGQELLQELLPAGQLSDPSRQLVHTLLELVRRSSWPAQQAVLELGEATSIAPPRSTEDTGAGNRRPEHAVCD
jgi:hypothetical protein